MAENARIVDHRLQSLKVSHRVREEVLRKQLASARTREYSQDERVAVGTRARGL